jgi:hypothetical protein
MHYYESEDLKRFAEVGKFSKAESTRFSGHTPQVADSLIQTPISTKQVVS